MGDRIQYLNISFYFRKFTILGVLRKLCVELYHLGPYVVANMWSMKFLFLITFREKNVDVKIERCSKKENIKFT